MKKEKSKLNMKNYKQYELIKKLFSINNLKES
jgi:hypothetical protein